MTTFKNIAAAAVASMVIFTNIAHAQVLKAGDSVNFEEPMEVKYLGNDGNYLTFQVTVQSPIPGKALLAIEDKKEGELYASNWTSNFKVQTIKIEKRGNQELNFKLVIGKKTFLKSFSVNTSKVETTTVAESDISRL